MSGTVWSIKMHYHKSITFVVAFIFSMLPIWFAASAADEQLTVSADNQHLEFAFPDSWTGDSYRNVSCRVTGIPDWLDGYFVALVNGAYGRQSDPAGARLIHMFDGLGALASIQFKDGMVRFSGKYLPTRAFKIWDFHGRDMNLSKVAWSTLRSPRMPKAKQAWDQIAADYLAFNPNMGLWRIDGSRVITVGENPEIGLQFDVASLSNFQKADLHDTNEMFTGRSSLKLMNMAAHSKSDADGTIYGTVSGLESDTNRIYQFVFRISTNGVRTLEGAFEYGRYEPSKCGSDLRYTGDKRVLAGLVKTVVTTSQYVIIPITSAIVNPCKYQTKSRKYFPPLIKPDQQWTPIVIGNYTDSEPAQDFKSAIEFGADAPVRFLIFHKQKRQFVTNRPLDSFPPRFMSHALNAYEIDDNRIIVDLVTYDDYETYDRSLYLDYILRDSIHKQIQNRPVRFTIDTLGGYIERTHLVPEPTQAPMEYPTINPRYTGSRYHYAYVVQAPFALRNQLGKIDAEDHSGSRNLFFSHGPSTVLGKAIFVPRPNPIAEDDGVLLSLGLETLSKRSILYVVDAKTMKEVGRAEIPVIVPFGLHARYFDRRELTESKPSYQTTDHTQPPAKTIDSVVDRAYPSVSTQWNKDTTTESDKVSITPPMKINSGNEDLYPIVVTQKSNTESSVNDPTPTVSQTSLPTTESSLSGILRVSTASSAFTTWLGGRTIHTAASPESNTVKAPLPSMVPPRAASFSNQGSRGYGVKSFYLSNGSFVEVYPDGSTKTYPPLSNYFASFNPAPLPAPVTMNPPYLGADPAFIQYVKNQIPTPPPFTIPTPFSVLASAPPTLIAPAAAPAPASKFDYLRLAPPAVPPVQVAAVGVKIPPATLLTSTVPPRIMFPGFHPIKAAATPLPPNPKFPRISPEFSHPTNSTFLVVDVLVDPSKRIRRPQLTEPLADAPEMPVITGLSSPPKSAAVPDYETEKRVIITNAASKPMAMFRSDLHPSRAGSAPVPNDTAEHFLEHGRGFLCNFFGKAITALGSGFCKMESEAETAIDTKPRSDG